MPTVITAFCKNAAAGYFLIVFSSSTFYLWTHRQARLKPPAGQKWPAGLQLNSPITRLLLCLSNLSLCSKLILFNPFLLSSVLSLSQFIFANLLLWITSCTFNKKLHKTQSLIIDVKLFTCFQQREKAVQKLIQLSFNYNW